MRNWKHAEGYIFTKQHEIDLDLKLVDIGLATSAAPTFFPCHVIKDVQFFDGGLVANNPS